MPKRHDEAVEAVYGAIRAGYKGSTMVLRDTGKYEEMDENRKQTLPQYLYSAPLGGRQEVHEKAGPRSNFQVERR